MPTFDEHTKILKTKLLDFRNQTTEAGLQACEAFLAQHSDAWFYDFKDLGDGFVGIILAPKEPDERWLTAYLPWKLVRGSELFHHKQTKEKGKYAIPLDEESLNQAAAALDRTLAGAIPAAPEVFNEVGEQTGSQIEESQKDSSTSGEGENCKKNTISSSKGSKPANCKNTISSPSNQNCKNTIVSSSLQVSYSIDFDIFTAPVHPAANLFREFKDSELDLLEKSIEDRQGIIDPLTMYDSQLLDGRHRREICKKLDLIPPFVVLPITEDPWQFVLDKHNRRELSKSERAATALDYARSNPLFAGMPNNKRLKLAADKFNVNKSYLDKLIRLEKKLGPQTLEEAKQGLWNIAARYRDIFGTPVAQAPPTKTISGVLEKAHKSLDKEIQSAIKTKQPIEKQDLVDMQKKARELRRNLQQLKQLVK